MDSVIHYDAPDAVAALSRLAERTSTSMVFTFAPRTALLSLMWTVGKVFPRGDRSPAIVPVAPEQLRAMMVAHPGLKDWQWGRSERISSGFYTSQATEWKRT
jgi:magnesium-protoporphyrin O-methyltransferase